MINVEIPRARAGEIIHESLAADGVFKVLTKHSEYLIDTVAKTATRTNTLGNNARYMDGQSIAYTHIECDLDANLVLLWHKPGVGDVWRTSTPVVSIELVG